VYATLLQTRRRNGVNSNREIGNVRKMPAITKDNPKRGQKLFNIVMRSYLQYLATGSQLSVSSLQLLFRQLYAAFLLQRAVK
jgi:hypothetical protein